mgnify:CR=1 FL=1
MKYKLSDQNGVVIAKGNQLEFNIKVHLDNKEMVVTYGPNVCVCDITGNDTFTLKFEKE